MNARIERWVIAACIAATVGTAVGVSLRDLLPWITDAIGADVMSVSFAMWLGTIVATIPMAVVCAAWLWSLAKQEGRSCWAWMFFGLIFTLPGVAVFYGVVILQRLQGGGRTN